MGCGGPRPPEADGGKGTSCSPERTFATLPICGPAHSCLAIVHAIPPWPEGRRPLEEGKVRDGKGNCTPMCNGVLAPELDPCVGHGKVVAIHPCGRWGGSGSSSLGEVSHFPSRSHTRDSMSCAREGARTSEKPTIFRWTAPQVTAGFCRAINANANASIIKCNVV